MRHNLLLLYSWFVRTILFFFPDAPIFMRLRGWMYSFGMTYAGKNFQVTHNAILLNLETIKVGSNCYIAYSSTLIANPNGPIILEDDVQIGPHCIVVSDNHTRFNRSFRYGYSDQEQIHIQKGCWIGGNSTVLKGSILPEGSALGANSVLNKKFSEPDCIYAGAPAIKIKKL